MSAALGPCCVYARYVYLFFLYLPLRPPPSPSLPSLDLVSLVALVLTQVLSIVYLLSEEQSGEVEGGVGLANKERVAAEWLVTIFLFAINSLVVITLGVGWFFLWLRAKGVPLNAQCVLGMCPYIRTCAASSRHKATGGKSALPEGWTEHVDEESGTAYYHDANTDVVSWTRPSYVSEEGTIELQCLDLAIADESPRPPTHGRHSDGVEVFWGDNYHLSGGGGQPEEVIQFQVNPTITKANVRKQKQQRSGEVEPSIATKGEVRKLAATRSGGDGVVQVAEQVELRANPLCAKVPKGGPLPRDSSV